MRGFGVAVALGAMCLVGACDTTDRPGSAPVSDGATSATTPASASGAVTTGAEATREQGDSTTDSAVSVVAATAPTSTTTTVAQDVRMPVPLRPYVSDSAACVARSAREADIDDVLTRLNPYALGAAWYQVQVVADPDLGADGPWAIVATITAHPRFDVEAWGADSEWLTRDVIGGWDVLITATPDGFTDALIDLGGAVDAYVRTYRFDPEGVRALIMGLAARTPPTEGFDVEAVAGLPGLEMTIDERNGPVEAHIAAVVCTVDDQTVRISAITGDASAQYILTLDQPYPDIVGRVGDAVVSIDAGRLAPDQAPALDDIVHATDEVWAELLRTSDEIQG